MAVITPSALNELNSAGIGFERVHEEHMCSIRQAALERQYREQQYMLSRAYANPPIGEFLAPMPPPMPPPPPVSGSHKRNKRLLLCHP